MTKPIIGISGSMLTTGSGDFATYKRSYVNDDYITSVVRAQGVPFIIPCTTSIDVINAQLDQIDALILSGGHDVDPTHYGEEPLQKNGIVFPERDAFELQLIAGALERKMPILGICRGFQLLNVFFGGSLYQDLSYQETTYIKHDQVDLIQTPTHHITIKQDSFLFDIFKKETIKVNSFHHQTIKTVGSELDIIATAPDGVIEGFQKTAERIYAVQFHPEMLSRTHEDFANIFSYFVNTI